MNFDKFSFQPKTVFISGIGSTNDLDRIKKISRQKVLLTFSNSKCTKIHAN